MDVINMYKLLLTILFLLALQGCVSMPDLETSLDNMYNVESSGSSKFDGSKYIRMSNMACSTVAFELYQDTAKSKNGIVLLNAGSTHITNIGKGKALLIKLDGELYEFESKDITTEYDSNYVGYGIKRRFSNKTFVVPENFVRKAAASKEFLVKVHLLNNKFIEGNCSPATLQEARKDAKERNLDIEITQEHLDMGNKVVAVYGFREFVRMMDNTAW